MFGVESDSALLVRKMAWFSGRVSLGNFPDIAGAVNKLQESVKNIEKNFDTALGFEEKDKERAESSNEGTSYCFYMITHTYQICIFIYFCVFNLDGGIENRIKHRHFESFKPKRKHLCCAFNFF